MTVVFWAAVIGGVLVALGGAAVLLAHRTTGPGPRETRPQAADLLTAVGTSTDVRAGIWILVGIATVLLSVIVFR